MEVTLVSRPSEPTGLTSNNATNANTADGTIAGVDNTMEYSADNGKTWIAVSQNTINGLIPGDYLVRVKATNDAPAGKTAKVTVGSKEIILKDTQKPTAKTNLVYTRSEQTLVNEPAESLPDGAKEMQYALGTDATNTPTSGWGTSIPTGTDAKTYYVWYKVVGDDNHNDTAASCITVTIKTKPDSDTQPKPGTNEGDKQVQPQPETKETEQQTQPQTEPQATAVEAPVNYSLLMNSGLHVSWKGSKVKVKWGLAPGADAYEVYAAYCGSSSYDKVLTVQTGNQAVITKLGGKKLNPKKSVKAYVVAYKNGTPIGQTIDAHSVGGKNKATNVKKIRTSKKAYTLTPERALSSR